MKDKILKLRAQGKTYNQIREELKCSKGTISYHCGKGQKEKTKERSKLHKATLKGTLGKRLREFLQRMSQDFRRSVIDKKHKKVTTSIFSVEDILNKIGQKPKCYLTGDSVDLMQYKTYQFDHIVPVKKGGENTLDNLGLCTRDANMSKTDLTLEEYLDLCEKVLRLHRGSLLK